MALSSVLPSELHKDWPQKTSPGVVTFSHEKLVCDTFILKNDIYIYIMFFACLLQLHLVV